MLDDADFCNKGKRKCLFASCAILFEEVTCLVTRSGRLDILLGICLTETLGCRGLFETLNLGRPDILLGKSRLLPRVSVNR